MDVDLQAPTDITVNALGTVGDRAGGGQAAVRSAGGSAAAVPSAHGGSTAGSHTGGGQPDGDSNGKGQPGNGSPGAAEFSVAELAAAQRLHRQYGHLGYRVLEQLISK
ncbi:hypothetical protein VOLCADRAFT_86561 [Volvox carteri f. nagariensis]|uniref:Uncharacterized protein n=1 Tax=Volvox carteri f. nagariensis TaxID=3068 RepID=D8TJ02_VOLCA|nr:uncharacterized protein VOLCADRAFT_86561 [Volvox carteri f. nagariensis]EFJ52455.1 hypothetical protein VOLCADRAFT_86561 [Volvox carteri f. nagariensis]|eukprot:XP_002946528.1 hypothetical protein VOLCADRAFT_86561 [Volvox carteri f. nagariensis]